MSAFKEPRSIPIVGEIFTVLQKVKRMVDVSKKNDKKAAIVRDTCKLIDPILQRYAGRKVDQTIVVSMNALHGHLEEEFRNITICITSFSTAVRVDMNLEVRKMAAKKDYKDYEQHDTSKVTKNAEINPRSLHYESDKPFAEGDFGKVYKAEYDGINVAVKKVDLSGLPMSARKKIICEFESELKIMFALRHPCTVDILGAITSDGNELSLVMKFVDRSDLRRILDTEYRSMNSGRKKGIPMDVAARMNYLYIRSPPLFHRDLKSLNILVTNQWKAKVSDFGMAKADTSAMMSSTNATKTAGGEGLGSSKWNAPEQLDYPPSTFNQACDVYSFGVVVWEVLTELDYPPSTFNQACDVYSFGVVVWEVLTGRVPFDGIPNEALSAQVKYKKLRPEPSPEGQAEDWLSSWRSAGRRRRRVARFQRHHRDVEAAAGGERQRRR
ncbi:hypothetical protein TrLO_g14151 [Triparma laevis f. longispina]|uniref:Protein kinase domain-containing protein n=1 Tax=Triparma laevis f. longispina TaxID=1714387 RepID=A0A9W7CCZ6_9STRA|nr:hypothetical protein TrLO_g14151 [Triparma laevis f. longispina]